MKLLYRYISKQFVKNFFILILIFSMVILSSQMIHLPKFVYSMNFFDLIRILLLLNLSFAKFTVLFGFFIAWLFVGIKLKENNEVYAIYSLGVGKRELLKPVVIWSVIFSILAIVFSVTLSPYANRERVKFLTAKVKLYLLDSLQQKSFSKVNEKVYVYIDKKEDNRFEKIVLQNKSNGFLITAKRGSFQGNYVILEDGYIQIPTEDSYRLMKFSRYSFSLDVSYLKKVAVEDLETSEVIKRIGEGSVNTNKMFSILIDRFSFFIPFMFVGFIGFVSGLSLQRSKEALLSLAVSIGIFYMLTNYLFVKLTEKDILFGFLYPSVLLAGFLGITFYLLRK